MKNSCFTLFHMLISVIFLKNSKKRVKYNKVERKKNFLSFDKKSRDQKDLGIIMLFGQPNHLPGVERLFPIAPIPPLPPVPHGRHLLTQNQGKSILRIAEGITSLFGQPNHLPRVDRFVLQIVQADNFPVAAAAAQLGLGNLP